MAKIRIDLNDIDVETFEVSSPALDEQGTVHGNQTGTCQGVETCGLTCPETCPPGECTGPRRCWTETCP